MKNPATEREGHVSGRAAEKFVGGLKFVITAVAFPVAALAIPVGLPVAFGCVAAGTRLAGSGAAVTGKTG